MHTDGGMAAVGSDGGSMMVSEGDSSSRELAGYRARLHCGVKTAVRGQGSGLISHGIKLGFFT